MLNKLLTVVCPDCAQQALVLGEDLPNCRFCLMTWDDPEEAAAEYTWLVLGEVASTEPDTENPIQTCPDCFSDSLVMGTITAAAPAPHQLCFSCVGDFTDTEFAACAFGCGRLVPADAQDLLCPAYTGIAIGRL
ncbi:hypothetical protein ACFVU4_32700 [Streptomyces sp. NPDC058107]|uniref:hypothetical protein n=1 Tax=Streptomyces sp. NPDC058107 TaxID=3346343 RepID=UPI0036EDF205